MSNNKWGAELAIYFAALIGLSVLLAMTSGCERAPSSDMDAYAYVGLALAAIQTSPDVAPDEPRKCCGECNGTGRVKTGDGLSTVPCECPDSCPCKANKSASNCRDCKSVLKGFAPLPATGGAK